jgi:hypothetical protein
VSTKVECDRCHKQEDADPPIKTEAWVTVLLQPLDGDEDRPVLGTVIELEQGKPRDLCRECKLTFLDKFMKGEAIDDIRDRGFAPCEPLVDLGASEPPLGAREFEDRGRGFAR